MNRIALASSFGIIFFAGTCSGSWASDCDFFLGQINNLKAACAAGSYCSDLEAFRQRARSEGCLPPADSGNIAGQKAPAVIAKPAPTPPAALPPSPKKNDCAAIPTDLETYKTLVALKYSAKVRALSEGLNALRQQRADLERSFNREIGSAGSMRESLTYIAATVKTTTDLINGLLEFAPGQGKIVGAAYRIARWKMTTRQIYDAISAGNSLKDLMTEDAAQVAIDISLETIEIDPVRKAAKLLNDLYKNISEMMEMPENFEVARREYNRALQILDGQIAGLVKKINDAKAASVQSGGEVLLQRYLDVRRMCAPIATSGPEIRPLR